MSGNRGSTLLGPRREAAAVRPTASNCAIALFLAGAFVSGSADPATAQALTTDPGVWRPLGYADLQKQSPLNATYVDIWKDAIDANTRAYQARGDRRYFVGAAPATEAHFVIWSAKRAVVVSVLDTALGCSEMKRNAGTRAVVKLCPMRVAIYDGLQVRTLDAGRSCFLETTPGAALDPASAVAYGAYDVATRVVKIGVIVDRRAIDGCSFNIPLGRE